MNLWSIISRRSMPIRTKSVVQRRWYVGCMRADWFHRCNLFHSLNGKEACAGLIIMYWKKHVGLSASGWMKERRFRVSLWISPEDIWWKRSSMWLTSTVSIMVISRLSWQRVRIFRTMRLCRRLSMDFAAKVSQLRLMILEPVIHPWTWSRR